MIKKRKTLSIDERDLELLDQIAAERGSTATSVGLRELCNFYRTHQQNRELEQATRTADHQTILDGLDPATGPNLADRWPGVTPTAE